MLVKVILGIEIDVEFEMAGFGFDAECLGAYAGAGIVGTVAGAVGVLEEVDLLIGLGGGEVDVVGGCYWVGFFFEAGGCSGGRC